jgi:N-acetylglucosamine kinase-like BadF-type ATPase
MLPGCRLAVVHDARLVLAAAGVNAGIAIIAGTGSVAFGRTSDGRETQRGGWGWMIGDDGGGAWITREASREVIGRAESGRPVGPLGEAILAACGARDSRELIANLHTMHEPMQWASVAPAVFATADVDPGAVEVIRRAAAALAQLVRQVQDAIGLEGPVVLAGGLLLNQPILEAEVRERTSAQCIRLEEPPVEGAVRLAEELLRL